ncbi:uncharacterized protein LOC135827882 isoform X1 [Sycon ciliatum]|uniref:uncharacterized protein LOC135827882 isoform X1 n=1 Tax=Sycon ciliatum TaxID=27933 RepID=UPI0031F61EB9
MMPPLPDAQHGCLACCRSTCTALMLVIAATAILSMCAAGKCTASQLSPAPKKPLSAEEKSAYRCEWIVHVDDALASGDQTLGSHIIDTVLPVDRIHHNDMTGDLLLQYVTSSRPLIVTGLVESWPAYRTWNLSWFIETYTEYGSLYDWGQQHSELTVDDYQRKVAENPRTYVAWVASGVEPEETNAKMMKDMDDHPPFMPAREPHSTLVHWVYGGLPAAGATTHRDNVCDGTWTAQFKGEKQWCFSTHRRLSDNTQNFYAVTQQPGEMIIFTIPMWHGTYLLSESFSVHGYFPLDSATNFTEKFDNLTREDATLDEDYSHCMPGFRSARDSLLYWDIEGVVIMAVIGFLALSAMIFLRRLLLLRSRPSLEDLKRE